MGGGLEAGTGGDAIFWKFLDKEKKSVYIREQFVKEFRENVHGDIMVVALDK